MILRVGISEHAFYRWKEQYLGLESDQVREMKQLQDENSRVKQLVAELSLNKTMPQDIQRKVVKAVAVPKQIDQHKMRYGANFNWGKNNAP